MAKQLQLDSSYFIDSLNTVSDVNAHYQCIDAAISEGHISIIRDVFARICNVYSFGPSQWPPQAIVERIIESLSLHPGLESAQAALDLLSATQQYAHTATLRIIQPSGLASRIAFAQPVEVLESLLSVIKDLETRALLLYEGVVRHKISQESRIAQGIKNTLQEIGHPLSILPLRLLPQESFVLPAYGSGSISCGMPFGPDRNRGINEKAKNDSPLAFRKVDTPERIHLISSAVLNWQQESNGKIEASAFRLDPSFTDFASVLPQLNLESLNNANADSFHDKVSVSDVFQVLFSAAANGGAYNHGVYAAYGRLMAWQSLSALSGLGTDVPIEAAAHHATNCRWCLFECDNEWFYQVAWDFGIACWTPKRTELSILCATDTD